MSNKQTTIFHQALESYEKRLLRYALKFVKNPETAQDIVQETFLRLWKEPPSKVLRFMAPWLFHVCRNLCIERQRKVAKMNPSQKNHWQMIDQVAVDPVAFENLAQRDLFTQLTQIIETLPPKAQEIIVLKFQNGFSHKEISRVTGMSTNHVGVTVHKIMMHLRDKMNANDQTSKGGSK